MNQHLLSARRRGNAMLELILILPVYVLILFVLMTLAEYGQVTTGLNLAARYVAWRGGDASTAAGVYLNHFAPRVTTGGASATVPVLQFDGVERGTAIPAVGSVTVSGAASYANGSLDDPLLGAQGTLLNTLANQTAGITLPAMAQADLVELTHLALDGDTQQPAGSDGIPWLRRRYAVMTATYHPIGGVIPAQTFRICATVLLGRSTGACQPAVYPASLANGTVPVTLRATPAAIIPPATAPVTGTRPGGHQMKALHTPQWLDHSATAQQP